jgi:hypothetical protein
VTFSCPSIIPFSLTFFSPSFFWHTEIKCHGKLTYWSWTECHCFVRWLHLYQHFPQIYPTEFVMTLTIYLKVASSGISQRKICMCLCMCYFRLQLNDIVTGGNVASLGNIHVKCSILSRTTDNVIWRNPLLCCLSVITLTCSLQTRRPTLRTETLQRIATVTYCDWLLVQRPRGRTSVFR